MHYVSCLLWSPPYPIQHLNIHININNNIYLKFFFFIIWLYWYLHLHSSFISSHKCTKKTTISNYIFFPDLVVTWQHRQHIDVLVGSPRHYHLQNRAYFLASIFRHCMIIISINYSLSLSLSLLCCMTKKNTHTHNKSANCFWKSILFLHRTLYIKKINIILFIYSVCIAHYS